MSTAVAQNDLFNAPRPPGPVAGAVEERAYQDEAIVSLRRSIATGHKSPILQQATGTGKTTVAAKIIKNAVEKGKRVLFLATRRELVYQASERFTSFGIRNGIIMAGERMQQHPDIMVQVASFDTLHARGIRSNRILMPLADVVIVDECRLSIAESRLTIVKYYQEQGSIVIGLDATPCRGDGKGLGAIYDDMILSWPVRRFMDEGYLVNARYITCEKPDLRGVAKDKDGDYQQKALGKVMDKPKLVGQVVEQWFKHAEGKQTVVFCVTRAHARHVYEVFIQRGVKAEYLDGETKADERKAILNRIKTQESMVLVNVFVATYGLDIPSLEVAVLARPTRNIALYFQIAGRVLRPSPGKESALIIDHSGAFHEHGPLDAYVPWSLDENTDVRKAKKKAEKKAGSNKDIHCKNCGTVFRGQRECPLCGHVMIPPGKPIPIVEGDLHEVDAGMTGDKAPGRNATMGEKIEFYGMLRTLGMQRGWSAGRIAHLYRSYFNAWPNDSRIKDAQLQEPNMTVINWVKYQNIKYARSKGK